MKTKTIQIQKTTKPNQINIQEEFEGLDLNEEFARAQYLFERVDVLEKAYGPFIVRLVEIKEMKKVYVVVDDGVGETVFSSFPTL